jgi:hypothetical protein
VCPGPAAQRGAGRRGHVAAEAGRGHRVDLGGGQRRQREHRARVAAGELAQQVGRRAGIVPRGDDQEHRRAATRVRQVLDHGERVRVRPMQVLERQHDAARPEHREQSQHGFAEDD